MTLRLFLSSTKIPFFSQWEGMSHKPYGVFRSYLSKKEWAGTGYRIVKPGAEAWGPFLESPDN